MTATKQQIYNKVKAHAAAQPRKAKTPSGACQYRTSNGDKCWVGCLIPDELYDPEMDYRIMMPCDLIYDYPKLVDYIGDDARFLSAIQEIHDLHLVEEWPAQLSQLATKHNLIP